MASPSASGSGPPTQSTPGVASSSAPAQSTPGVAPSFAPAQSTRGVASSSAPAQSTQGAASSSAPAQSTQGVASSSAPPRVNPAPPMQQHEPQPLGAIEADDYDSYEDSAFGSEASSYSTSLSPSVTDYPIENGRRYHAYQKGRYILPNDEKENDRLDLQHQMLYLLHDLHRAPLKDPQKILDIGTGTGIWALEMADKFPSAEVIGNDLSPIQPTWVPPNLRFEVDDAESTWPYKRNSFDYIHTRFMVGSVGDWPRLFEQAFKHTKPGGYIEVQEPHCGLFSEDDTLVPESAIVRWMKLFAEGARINKRPVDMGPEFKPLMEKAGFINVHVELFRLPHSPWPKDPRLKEIGAFNLVNVLEGLEGLSLFLFTKVLGWSTEEVGAFLPEVLKDFHKKEYHLLSNVYCVWAQKPLDAA